MSTSPKFCLNYESGKFEWIERDGFSWDRGDYVVFWDDSEYRREEEEERRKEEARREAEEKKRRRRDDEEEVV